jgi:hypothetical protein
MMKKVRLIQGIQIMKPKEEPDLMAIKAKGIAELKKLVMPKLVPRAYDFIPEDGIFEMDFFVDNSDSGFTDVEMEVDIVFRLKNLPDWVKGVRIYATENSDIELL